jgi:hypothetical protein
MQNLQRGAAPRETVEILLRYPRFKIDVWQFIVNQEVKDIPLFGHFAAIRRNEDTVKQLHWSSKSDGE